MITNSVKLCTDAFSILKFSLNACFIVSSKLYFAVEPRRFRNGCETVSS